MAFFVLFAELAFVSFSAAGKLIVSLRAVLRDSRRDGKAREEAHAGTWYRRLDDAISLKSLRAVMRSHDPRKAIAPSMDRSRRALAPSSSTPLNWVELALSPGDGKPPSL